MLNNLSNNLSKLQIVTLNDFAMNIVNWLDSNDAIEDSLSDFQNFLSEKDKFIDAKQKLIGNTLEEKYIEWNCLYENKNGSHNWIVNIHSEYLGNMEQEEYYKLVSTNIPYILEQIKEIRNNYIDFNNSSYNIEKYNLENEGLTR
ncbi:hypothetical protein [Spiroplasma citri]|uniref:hypothetical protein n=1 Tax=Spiroplasma citri TaxID=2133 RepID=UPI0011BB83FF|nr:hypothetical protein [Spiroplasma citri]QED24733.1 hypothetical protein FRX96_04695 [Spiroplasma citri]QJU61674.1 hypothetical protein HHA36_04340 [Spiroplasma citri]